MGNSSEPQQAFHFAEPNPKAKQEGQPRNIWFGLNDPPEGLFAFAGLWRPWDDDWIKDRGSSSTEVYTIFTTEPNDLVEPVHKKAMPVILASEDYET